MLIINNVLFKHFFGNFSNTFSLNLIVKWNVKQFNFQLGYKKKIKLKDLNETKSFIVVIIYLYVQYWLIVFLIFFFFLCLMNKLSNKDIL